MLSWFWCSKADIVDRALQGDFVAGIAFYQAPSLLLNRDETDKRLIMTRVSFPEVYFSFSSV